MEPHEVEEMYAEFAARVKEALVPEPGDPPTGRKVMEVGKFGKQIHTDFGRAQVLSFVTFILGANHGFRIEMIGPKDFIIRSWDHSKTTGISTTMLRVNESFNVSHLELACRMVAIPFKEK